jgi:hypothetical protein
MIENYELEVEQSDGTVAIYVVTSTDNGATSMLKSTYEAMQAEQSTPMVADK